MSFAEDEGYDGHAVEDYIDHLDYVACWHCFGEGAFHECGEDTCCCLDKSPNVDCEECGGEGYL
jgi:hypothetical protein